MGMNRKQRYEQLVRDYGGDMYRVALWLSRDPAIADDVVQEAYARAWKSIDKLKDIHAAKSWLLTIVRREHARLYERKRLETVDMDDVILEAPQDSDPAQRDTIRTLRLAISQLDDKYRLPLVMQVFGGYSCQEIADELDCSTSAVMTQLFRARQKLKVALTDDSDNGQGVVHELY